MRTGHVHRVQPQIVRLLSKDLSISVNLATDHTAEERLAGFLISIAARSGAGTELKLVMPRRDIASYLRLATETVSRRSSRTRRRRALAMAVALPNWPRWSLAAR